MPRRLPTLYHTIALPFAALSVALTWGFLHLTSQIETDELAFRLSSLSVRADANDASDILLRLEAEQKANAGNFARTEIPVEELGLLAAFPEKQATAQRWLNSNSVDVEFVRKIIIWLQRAAGIVPVTTAYLENSIDLTTLAYNLERRRYFSEALLTFQKAMRPTISAATQDFILLHSGFCSFFLADYRAAEKSWQEVYKSASNTTNQNTANKLLVWLHNFQLGYGAAERIVDLQQRALRYYQLLAYKESLESLMHVADSRRDDKYYLLRARTHEAPGDFTAAIADYSRAIRSSRSTDTARLANRRLYFMSALYRRQDNLALASKAAGVVMRDDLFFEKSAEYIQILPPVEGVASKSAGKTPAEVIIALRSIEADKTSKPVKEPARRRIIRVKTRNGSIITGRQVSSSGSEIVIENDNGRFRIPSDDIESKEFLSGN